VGLRLGTQIEIKMKIHPDKSKSQLRASNRNKDPSLSGALPIDGPPGSVDSNLPSCARDVFLTLHKEEGGENEHSCRGLLIRDDIIITSRECSKFDFTFDFSGLGVLQAVPHSSLNEQVLDSRLGFLEASPPYHHHFINQPIHRTRMFLSPRPNPAVNGTEDGPAVVWTCDDHKPIAHNFLVDGEMVPLGQLLGAVPEDILWEHMDIDTAPKLNYKSDRWWTRSVTREEEEVEMKQMLDQYEGPPGSISIPKAHDDLVGQMVALCEAVDPRGHRRDCFKNYYTRWREERPFSGMHFFDWLDFGHGKFLLEKNSAEHLWRAMERDEKCLKKDFNRKTVYYFKEEEIQQHEVYLTPSEDGKKLIARYKHNDEPVPQSDMGDPHLYMWDLNKTFYIVDNRWDKERYGTIKHTGLLAGAPALSAGKAYFGKNGAIRGINYSSGHYRPEIQSVSMMYQWVKDQGFNVNAFHWVGRASWATKSCEETDWGSIQIPGFTASALNQSCHDVTMSPTWILKDDV